MFQQAQDVNAIIDHLASKLSVPTEHLWRVLTTQARVEAFTDWAWAGAWLLLTVVLGVVAWSSRRALDKDLADYDKRYAAHTKNTPSDYWRESRPEHGDAKVVIAITATVLCSITLIIAFAFSVGAVRLQANPEYYALSEVLAAVRK